MAYGPRRKKPITAERVERALDTLAWIISRSGPDAHLGAPLWKRLEAELARLREEEEIVAAARARVRANSAEKDTVNMLAAR